MKKTLMTCSILFLFVFILPALLFAQAPSRLDIVKWEFPQVLARLTINLVGDNGHNLRPYEFWKSDFEQVGLTIAITEVPFRRRVRKGENGIYRRYRCI